MTQKAVLLCGGCVASHMEVCISVYTSVRKIRNFKLE